MKAEQKQAGWGVGLLWVLATLIGAYLGLIAGMGSGIAIHEKWGDLPITIPLLGILIGTMIGILQWLVLRWCVGGAGWWIPASAIGGFGFFTTTISGVYGISLGILATTVVVAVYGAVAGMLQWLVIRNRVSRSGWWIVASAVGWAAIIPIAPGLSLGYINVIGLFSIVLGAETGGTLVWLLRQPALQVNPETT